METPEFLLKEKEAQEEFYNFLYWNYQTLGDFFLLSSGKSYSEVWGWADVWLKDYTAIMTFREHLTEEQLRDYLLLWANVFVDLTEIKEAPHMIYKPEELPDVYTFTYQSKDGIRHTLEIKGEGHTHSELRCHFNNFLLGVGFLFENDARGEDDSY